MIRVRSGEMCVYQYEPAGSSGRPRARTAVAAAPGTKGGRDGRKGGRGDGGGVDGLFKEPAGRFRREEGGKVSLKANTVNEEDRERDRAAPA